MRQLVECVPNFSEGRDRAVIDAIADAVRQTPGCTLLDVDPGQSTNRTVYTFVGLSRGGGRRSAQRRARGEGAHRHASPPAASTRAWAPWTCVPSCRLPSVTMEDCVECAREFGRRAGEELGIPIYLYEEAATQEHRKSLRQIRAGEYEGLAERIVRPEWKPDFGPAAFVPSWGATATGARFFLIAYNVNVLGTKEQAHRIALDVREQGRGPDQPGRLQKVKGIGWWVDEYGMAQVSMNLDDYKITPPHVAFEECAKDARALNLAVAGSELVGLIPLEAMLMAAEHYIESENLFILDERQKIRLVGRAARPQLGLAASIPTSGSSST